MSLEFILEFMNLKIFGSLILLIVLIYFLAKQFFPNFLSFKFSYMDIASKINKKSSPSKNSVVDDLLNDENLAKEISDEIKGKESQNDFLKLIDSLPDKNETLELNENKINSKFIQDIYGKEFDKNNNTDDTILLSDDIIEHAQELLEKKIGARAASMVRRTDESGRIVLDMAAINYITGKNVPIIMPDSTIRVLNFLTLEEEVEKALFSNKPFFIVKEDKSISRLTKEQIEKVVITEDVLSLNQNINSLKEQSVLWQKQKAEYEEKINELLEQKNIFQEESKKFKNMYDAILIFKNEQGYKISEQNIMETSQDMYADNLINKALDAVKTSEEKIVENSTHENSKQDNSKNAEIENIDLSKNVTNEDVQILMESFSKNKKQKNSKVEHDEKTKSINESIIPSIDDDSSENKNEKKEIIVDKTKNTSSQNVFVESNEFQNEINSSSAEEIINNKIEINEQVATPLASNIETISNVIPDNKNIDEEKSVNLLEQKQESAKNAIPVIDNVENQNQKQTSKKTLDKKYFNDICSNVIKIAEFLSSDTKNKVVTSKYFIASKSEKYNKNKILYFNKTKVVEFIEEYLMKNDFNFNNSDVENIIKEKKFENMGSLFFVDKSSKSFYNAEILKIEVNEEEIYGQMLSTVFTEPCSREAYVQKTLQEKNSKTKSIFELNIANIDAKKYISI